MAGNRCAALAAWLVAAALCLVAAPATAQDEAALWAALRAGGHVALLRHALAPGTGDPAAFALGDCGTQRNLSAAGRAQAARIGARLRENRIAAAQVYSSQWCRCMETARLLDLGRVEELPALNSFFRRYEREEAQTRAIRTWLTEQTPGTPVVLVTHQVNITALTGVYPASGELVVVRLRPDGTLDVVGSIETD